MVFRTDMTAPEIGSRPFSGAVKWQTAASSANCSIGFQATRLVRGRPDDAQAASPPARMVDGTDH
jgi:hypothetical protein